MNKSNKNRYLTKIVHPSSSLLYTTVHLCKNIATGNHVAFVDATRITL